MLFLFQSFAESFLGMCVYEQFQNSVLQHNKLRILCTAGVLGKIWSELLIMQIKKLRKIFPGPEACLPFISTQQEQMRVW